MITDNFVNYFNDFYGKNGVYAWREDIPKEILEQALSFLKLCYRFKTNTDYVFTGDSVDRELLRDIIFNCNEQEYVLYKNS